MLQFQNYHRHSYYTNVRVSDSTASNEDYAKRAAEIGHGIISTCEHGTAGRYIEGYELAEKYNLKFLMGAEAYWVKDRFEKDRTNCHIYIGARNESGRQAVNDVLSEACLTGFYGQPRIDIPLLLSLPANDIWCTSACLAFWKYDDVDDVVAKLKNHFGKNFYLEVQYHNTDRQREINRHILALSKSLNIPLIMGCDSHYIYEEDAIERADFIASKGMEYADEQGWFLDYPDGDTAYKRFADQCVLSHEQILEAINNTNVFLEVEPYENPCFTHDVKMPTVYPDWTQEQKDAEYDRLVWNAWESEKQNVPQNRWAEYEREIKREIDIVHTTLHSDYFLLDHEIIKRGRELGGVITSTGRGSGVSFITNKLLGLTDVDRIAATVKMYPERFMSPTRILETKSLADLDINCGNPSVFAKAQKEILGEDHAYPMIAYGTMKPKAAWKMYAKSQNVDFEIANEVSVQISKYEKAVAHANEDDRDTIDVHDYIEQRFHEIYDQSEIYRGVVVSASIHPCSYLLYQGNIRREIGLTRAKDNIVCCMDGKWAEEYKFLKNDLLKVSVVDLIDRVYKRVGQERHSIRNLLAECPPTSEVWDVYKKGCTLGINQCEQDGTRQRVMKYAPHNISEICAFVAAIRPGFKSMYSTFESRKHFDYGIKSLDDLIQTPEMPNSFIMYQEQSMAALNYAGIPMSECYEIIKNIAKKRVEKVFKYKDQFLSEFSKAIMRNENTSAEMASKLSMKVWQILEDSSRYSFNACLSDDTHIRKAGRHNCFDPTLHEMFMIKNSYDYAVQTGHKELHKKYKAYGYGNALSMYPDLRIRKNKIIDIRESGVRKIYKVMVQSGEWIQCTDNHKFPTPNGEKMLSDLSVGDTLYVSGAYEKNNKRYGFTDGNFDSNVPRPGEKGFQKNPNGNSVMFMTEKNRHAENGDACAVCGIEYDPNIRFELHHVDFDRTNNQAENLKWCCVSCHKKLHYRAGRTKTYEKGIPTNTSQITAIEYIKDAMTYDIEMESPAHTIVSDSGLVASNSHSYCVALDSLYGAYLKTKYPLEFYETFLRVLEEKGDKDRMAAVKDEAESYFNIKFPPYRFGQDNRSVVANHASNEITNTMSAIKGFGESVGETLYECGQQSFASFIEVLKWLDEHSIKSSKTTPLIKIDYFMEFGNIPTLLAISEMFDFFKQGSAKVIKKEKAGQYAESLLRFSTSVNAKGVELKSYSITDCWTLMADAEKVIKALNLPDLDYKAKANMQIELLGYVDLTTGKEEDRKKLIITDYRPLLSKDDGNVWAYRLFTKSIGSGKSSAMTCYNKVYRYDPIKKGDIIYVKAIAKNNAGYWMLQDYDKIA